MRRALVPGGALGIAVWHRLDRCPCVAATVAALDRHLGADVADRLRAPCSLGDPALLRALIETAGFIGIEIREAVVTRRMLPAARSIPGHLASTPVGPQIAALDAATQTRLVDDISAALAAYEVPGGLEIPQATLIATAKTERKPS